MTPSPAHRIVLDTASRMVPRVFAVLIFLAGALLLIADFAPINPAAMPSSNFGHAASMRATVSKPICVVINNRIPRPNPNSCGLIIGN